MSLEERALRGVPWTVLSFAAPHFVFVISTVVLARLVAPADFGLITVAILVTSFVGIFRELGLGEIVASNSFLVDVHLLKRG